MRKDEITSVQRDLIRRLRSGRGRNYALRMTAMIDVIFLLLIFFVLTAKFRTPEQALSIQLPGPRTEVTQLDVIEPLYVEIAPADQGCRIIVGKDGSIGTIGILNTEIETGLTTLAEMITAAMDNQKRNTSDPIELKCHDDVSWDHLVKVYNVMNAIGFSNITFDMEP